MRMKKLRLRISLYTRFMLAVTVLLVLLVISILLVIEKREVKTIFVETRNKGLLLAQNIANLNLHRLLFWDIDPIKRSIDEQIDEKLIYVVFYDRFNTPLAANDFIRKHDDIFCCSRLPEEVTPQSSFFKTITLRSDGRILRIMELEIPIFAEGSPTKWGSVKIGISLEDMHAAIKETRIMLGLIGCGGFLVGLLGATLLSRHITRPLKKLVEGTKKISRGEFSHKIAIDSEDEIGNLARSFNAMTRDLLHTRERVEEAHRKLVQAEKLASIGRIAATIAHEIRNPLTSVKLNIQKVSQSECLDEIEKEHLGISQEGIGQIEKFIKELLSYTRASELNRERFIMAQIVDEAVRLMSGALGQKKIVLERNFEDGLPPVLVDGDKMRQVFLNVIRNACESVDDGGNIRLSLALSAEKDGKKIRALIEDDGCGIAEKDLEVIFEPFFTTKASGFGLGLANARKILEQHKGVIRVVPKKGKGTAFEILIPGEGET